MNITRYYYNIKLRLRFERRLSSAVPAETRRNRYKYNMYTRIVSNIVREYVLD